MSAQTLGSTTDSDQLPRCKAGWTPCQKTPIARVVAGCSNGHVRQGHVCRMHLIAIEEGRALCAECLPERNHLRHMGDLT
jgi:hypothetical protein